MVGGKQEQSFSVEGMTCQHCVQSVKKAVSALSGVSLVEVNLEAKKVTVLSDDGKVPRQAIVRAIEEAGYEVVE